MKTKMHPLLVTCCFVAIALFAWFLFTPRICENATSLPWGIKKLHGATNISYFNTPYLLIFECDISVDDYFLFKNEDKMVTKIKYHSPSRIVRFGFGQRNNAEEVFESVKKNYSNKIFHVINNGECYYIKNEQNYVIMQYAYDFDENKLYFYRHTRGGLYTENEIGVCEPVQAISTDPETPDSDANFGEKLVVQERTLDVLPYQIPGY